MYFALEVVAIGFPSGNLGGQNLSIFKSTVETLTAEDAQFGL
jgi:hypothetical protein